MMAGKIERRRALEGVAAEAGPGEHGLGHHRSGQQVGVGEAAESDDRDHGVGQHVANDHGLLAQPFGAAHADVILAEAFEHAGPGRAGDEAQRGGRQHDHGQDQVRGGVLEAVPVARPSVIP